MSVEKKKEMSDILKESYNKIQDLHKSNDALTNLMVKFFIENYSPLSPLFFGKAKQKKSIEEEKQKLVKELIKSDINPVTFDILMSNEINRRLKVRFGVAFLLLTLLFTIASYTIVLLNAINKLGISETAITALVIEIPIQFIGLLYIIARNLFPNAQNGNGKIERIKVRENEKDV